MIHDILGKMGLNKKEVESFLILLSLGTQPASVIGKQMNIPRNTARFVLDQLFDKHFVTKSYKGNTQLYSPIAPQNIVKLLEMEKNRCTQKIDQKIDDVKKMLPELESMVKQEIILPKVSFYEGSEGIESVLNDSLDTDDIIYTYSDIDGMQQYISDINDRYVAKRQKLNVKKKAIILDTPFARKFLKGYYSDVTEFRFIDHKLFPFTLEMEIYNNKISYMTFSDQGLMAVLIENKEIYDMNRSIFEHVWKHAKQLKI